MKRKQNITAPDLHLVGTRLTAKTREDFRKVAEAQHRSVAAELRRMIEERIAESEKAA